MASRSHSSFSLHPSSFVLPPFLHRGGDFAIGFPCLLRGPFVVLLLAADDGDLRLDAISLEVKAEGNDRESFFDRLDEQLLDLAAVQQQLARPLRVMVLAITVRVGRDVCTEEESLPLPKDDVGV